MRVQKLAESWQELADEIQELQEEMRNLDIQELKDAITAGDLCELEEVLNEIPDPPSVSEIRHLSKKLAALLKQGNLLRQLLYRWETDSTAASKVLKQAEKLAYE